VVVSLDPDARWVIVDGEGAADADATQILIRMMRLVMKLR
jgi:hypothetical protein